MHELNWIVVFIISENNGVFLFEESQYAAAVDDVSESMKETVETMEIKEVIVKQSNMMLNFMNITNDCSVDLEMWDTVRLKYFPLSVLWLMPYSTCAAYICTSLFP